MLKKVSVIVPVYNASETLIRCVKSIKNQSYKDIEIILIYNKSSDDSLYICQSLKNSNSNITLIMNDKNMGPSYARNQGIGEASGYYVYFMDSDDWLLSNTVISNLVSRIERTKSAIIIAGYMVNNTSLFCEYGNETVLNQKELLNYILSIDVPKSRRVEGYLWNKMFILSIIRDNHIMFNTNYRMWEDLLFCVEYILQINRGVFWDKNIYMYSKNSNSITNSLDLKKSLEWSEAGLSIADNLRRAGLLYDDFMNILVNVFMFSIINEIKEKGEIKKSSKYYKYIIKYKGGLRKKYRILLFLLRNTSLPIVEQYLKFL